MFIAGESYGGYRVGRLVRMLQETAGIGLSGAVLISPALELGSLSPTDYDVLAWVDLVPTMALAAIHHGRSRAFAAGAPLDRTFGARRRVSPPASTPPCSRAGRRCRQTSATGSSGASPTSSAFPPASSRAPRAASRSHTFTRELLRDERKVLGLYDATVTATDPFPDREAFAGPDPTLAGIGAAYTTAINRQLRSEIGVETDREYVLLSHEVNEAWRNDAPQHFFTPPVGATDDFRYGMSLNPHLRAFIAHGRYDLVTPYYASDRLRNLMRLDADMAGRLTVRHFSGGHMFYAWEESRRELTAAIAAFVGVGAQR